MGKREIKPYVVKNSEKSIQELLLLVNNKIFEGYSADYTYGALLNKIVVNPLFNYKLFLSQLKRIPNLEFVTHRDLLRQNCPEDKVRVSIRHDVDGDIVAAIKQAEIEKELGIVTSWYILHTSFYYGFFKKDVFHRHESMGYIYRHLQDLGHEVALHTDPLLIYQEYKIDGAQALVEELKWLRSMGLNIEGTVAHNSKEVYGAYNYEIFIGRNSEIGLESGSDTISNIEKETNFNGKWAPLQVLDEKKLKLYYEGNEVFWQKKVPLEYGATRALDRWRWNAQIRRIKDREDPLDTYFIDHERLMDDVAGIKPGTFLVFVVHPLYYGSRHKKDQSPPLRVNKISTFVNPKLGWTTYKPNSFQCWSNDLSVEQEYQSINKSNEFGMLDLPHSVKGQKDECIILILGSDNIDGRQVGIPVQIQSHLGELLSKITSKNIMVKKLAFPGMGISRLWSWYEKTKDTIRPQIVLLGIGSQAIRQNVPLIWSKELGFSINHPPGDYLGWDSEKNLIKGIKVSPYWAIRQRKRLQMKYFNDCNCSIDEIMADDKGFKFDQVDCFDFLTESYRFACEQIRKSNSTPVIFVEESGEGAGFFHERKNDSTRSKFINKLNKRFECIAKAINVPIINPYEHFAKHANGLPTHFQDDKAWNSTGHRLAAESICLGLKSLKMF